MFAVGCHLLEFPLQGVDPCDVRRNEMVSASFASLHPEVTACVSGGGTSAAQVDEGGEILLLLWSGHHTRTREDGGQIAVQVYGGKLGGVARKRADIGAETAVC